MNGSTSNAAFAAGFRPMSLHVGSADLPTRRRLQQARCNAGERSGSRPVVPALPVTQSGACRFSPQQCHRVPQRRANSQAGGVTRFSFIRSRRSSPPALSKIAFSVRGSPDRRIIASATVVAAASAACSTVCAFIHSKRFMAHLAPAGERGRALQARTQVSSADCACARRRRCTRHLPRRRRSRSLLVPLRHMHPSR